MKPTREEIKAYFDKAPARQKFITEMRRVIAHEMYAEFMPKYDISRMIYGKKSDNKIPYLLSTKPQNKHVIDNWQEWILKGLYPISKVKAFYEKPISKTQPVNQKTGLTQINRVVLKLVEL